MDMKLYEMNWHIREIWYFVFCETSCYHGYKTLQIHARPNAQRLCTQWFKI